MPWTRRPRANVDGTGYDGIGRKGADIEMGAIAMISPSTPQRGQPLPAEFLYPFLFYSLPSALADGPRVQDMNRALAQCNAFGLKPLLNDLHRPSAKADGR